MRNQKIKVLFKREILDILRDKKTVLAMIVLPLVLYPLLIISMTMITSSVVSSHESKTYKVAFCDCEDTSLIREIADSMEAYDNGNNQTDIKRSDDNKTDSNNTADNTTESNNTEINNAQTKNLDTNLLQKQTNTSETSSEKLKKLEFVEDKDVLANPEKALNEDKIDAYVLCDSLNTSSYQIYFKATSDDSQSAANELEDVLKRYKDLLIKEKLNDLGLSENEILHPISYETKNVSSNEQTMGKAIGSMIPMLLIVSIMMGAIFPAINVTAGEKERGTLETLLTLPVSNFEMIMSKFLAVSVVSCICTILNIVSMGGAVGFLILNMSALISSDTKIQLSQFIPALLIIVLVMLVFSLFVAAISMCICIFAKSFKEANNYITPFTIIFMLLSMVPVLPDVKLTMMTSVIPVVNISLMIRQLLVFDYSFGLYFIVLLCNIVYSLLTILLLSKIYNSEAVLFSEGSINLKLFQKRSEIEKNQIPGIGDIILILCLTLLMMFYVGSYVQLKYGFIGVVVTQFCILIIPILYSWYIRVDCKKVFSLCKPLVLQVIGIVFFWMGGFLAMLIAGSLASQIFTDSSQNILETFSMIFKQPLFVLILVIALMPAIGEELLFRGFVFGTLKQKMKPIYAVLISAFLFGIYHMSLVKLFTTTILGIYLAIAVYKSGNIFMSMLMHFLNNLTAVLIMYFADTNSAAQKLSQESALSPLQSGEVLLGCVIFTVIGYLVLTKTTNQMKQTKYK